MKKTMILTAALALMVACAQPQPFHVIPMPADVAISEGSFCVKGAAYDMDENVDVPSQNAILRFVHAL